MRVPVQADARAWTQPRIGELEPFTNVCRVGPGTIELVEHIIAWEAYAKKHGEGIGPTRIAESGGFKYYELCDLLGHEPKTWRVR